MNPGEVECPDCDGYVPGETCDRCLDSGTVCSRCLWAGCECPYDDDGLAIDDLCPRRE